MSDLVKIAKEYLEAGLSVIPTTSEKAPTVKWTKYQSERMSLEAVDSLFMASKAKGIAVICGAISGGLEVIDVDCKYDLTGSLWENLDELLRDNLPEIYDSLVIAKTVSGGYHIYYRCKEIGRNDQLAERELTQSEKEAGEKAKAKVIIETRGEGGYVIAPPTIGYEYLRGSAKEIPEITTTQRETILAICKAFNEIEPPEPKGKKKTKDSLVDRYEITSLEDYDKNGEPIDLLTSEGWEVVREAKERIYLKRPGDTQSESSGNYHKGLKRLVVFSTNTDFIPGKAYSPSHIYTVLKTSGDWAKTARELGEKGYGKLKDEYKGEQKKKQIKLSTIEVIKENTVNKVNTVICEPGQTLTKDLLHSATGERICIKASDSNDFKETLEAVKMAHSVGKKIYIKEGEDFYTFGSYYGWKLLQEYEKVGKEKGNIDYAFRDEFREKVVKMRSELLPGDRVDFTDSLIKPLEEHGFNEALLSVIEEDYRTSIEEAQRNEKTEKLLDRVSKLEDKGKAIEILKEGIKDIDATAGKGLLPTPLSFNSVLEGIANLPPAYKTGYKPLDEIVGFTPGAITLIAGRPGHGKTTLMFNLLLEMTEIYPDKKFYFFSYEEPISNIFVKLLNRLIDKNLGGYIANIKNLARATNYEIIKAYIKAERTDIEEIEEGKEKLGELIDSQKINIVDRSYSVEELYSLIGYLNKREDIGAIFIDYIQRMNTEEKIQEPVAKLAHISNQVLQIAKDSGLPIILGAQLNRSTKSGDATQDNLKGAGNLEEDANTVISVYCQAREEEEDKLTGEQNSKLRDVKLELKTLKNREGEPNAKVELYWDRWTGNIKETPPKRDN